MCNYRDRGEVMSNEQKHILAERDYMAGMKYINIADKYEVSLNTVKSWKKRHGWVREKGAHKTKKGCTQKEGAKATKKKAIAEEVESVIDNPDLTDEHRLFCLQYVRRFNATKAYQKVYNCGYETAMVNGCKLLRNTKIKAEIDRLKQGKFNRAMLKPEDIFQKYMDIAFADITDYVEFGTDEVPVMSMYGPVKVKDKDTGKKVPLTKIINVVRFKGSGEVDGTLISEIKQGKDGASIKLPSREKALDWLAAHMDMATEDQKARLEYVRAQIDHIKADDGNTGESVVIVDDIPDESKSD